MKDKYEISIWEDCLGQGTGISTIPNYGYYNQTPQSSLPQV